MHMALDVRFELGDLRFTWDPDKHRRNVEKHTIGFEEAATTWLDPKAGEVYDAAHSQVEDRWLRIGFSLRGALLVTWFLMREQGGQEVVRIIGARRANLREQRIYEEIS